LLGEGGKAWCDKGERKRAKEKGKEDGEDGAG